MFVSFLFQLFFFFFFFNDTATTEIYTLSLHDALPILPVLQRRGRADPEPVEQRPVGGAAGQVHVLAVVDGKLAAAERGGRPAEPGPGLQQRDRGAGLAQCDRRADPGQAAADDDDVALAHCGTTCRIRVAGRVIPARDRTATMAFSLVVSDSLVCRTAAGWAEMRSSSRR